VCPVCEVTQPWARAVLDAYEWVRLGGALEDVAPSPTCALIDGVLALAREVRAAEAWESQVIAQTPSR
jgi:hypothetical protein